MRNRKEKKTGDHHPHKYMPESSPLLAGPLSSSLSTFPCHQHYNNCKFQCNAQQWRHSCGSSASIKCRPRSQLIIKNEEEEEEKTIKLIRNK